MNAHEPAGSLLARTQELLSTSNVTYLEIYRATGLTPLWLSTLANDKVANPSVNRIQKLYEFLTGKQLVV